MGCVAVCVAVCGAVCVGVGVCVSFVARVRAPFKEAAPWHLPSALVCACQPLLFWPQAFLPQTPNY